ncbi:hypothetical protein MAPG_08733 [Magnaporthiopsis poae ATCC 64411]|uniref:F-box domain-containing protein n=1 Tax=Magnaporthiopsis poae (strain ATCC 64411 / 73-15) TaxID=644358 RepID=A0A0C4E845_MAGP6|nr:hypothetical protein MAPG_08733 [Magnaporthiopsis poae ATCC 64411]
MLQCTNNILLNEMVSKLGQLYRRATGLPPSYGEAVEGRRENAVAATSTTALDPLVAALLYNNAHSPVYRLPPHILGRIVDFLDITSRSCLRHVSSLFFRELKEPGRPPAPTHGESIASIHGRLPNLCNGCVSAAARPDFEARIAAAFDTYLYCEGCGLEHQAWLFSPAQRTKRQGARVCIAHEGVLRICAHKTVTLRELGPRIGRITPPSGDTPMVHRIIASCRHPSHRTLGCGSSPKVLETAYTEGGKFLDWGWETSIRVPSGRKPTAQHFRNQFAKMRQEVGRYIVPPRTPGDLPELRTIDPGKCGCVEYEGSQLLPGGAPAWRGNYTETPFPDYHIVWSCTSAPQETLSRNVILHRCPCSTRGATCIKVRWGSRFLISRNFDSWMYEWCVALDPDSYGGSITNDDFFRNITWCDSPGCMNYAWSDWRFRKPGCGKHSREGSAGNGKSGTAKTGGRKCEGKGKL